MSDYLFDPFGKPMSAVEWAQNFERCEDEGRRHLGDDRVGAHRISTVYLGIHVPSRATSRPMTFETMTFCLHADANGCPWDCERWLAPTPQLALLTHMAVVGLHLSRYGIAPA